MIDKTFPVGESPQVKVVIRSGGVVVEPGEPGVVRMTVETNDPTFDVLQRGDSITAAGESGGRWTNNRAHVVASVPPGVEMDITTASGDIVIAPALRRLDVTAASGDLQFEAVHRLQAKTASGSIRGRSVGGEARCITASGDIVLGEVIERADLSTASGDILIRRCAGSVSCATASGDIAIKEMTGASLNVKSMSGAVTLGVPTRTRIDLDASSLSGQIRIPTSPQDPEPPDREMTVKVRLVSGDLRIERSG